MVIKILNSEELENYEIFLNAHPESKFEYTLIWQLILQKNFGFKPFYLISKNKYQEINGVLPLFKASSIFGKRLVSTPFAIYSGVLADNKEIANDLINYAKQLACDEKVDFLEIRERKKTDYPISFTATDRSFNFSLSLSENVDEVWKKLPKGSVRWGVKKARKSGLAVICGNTKNHLDVFYDLFLQTRKFRGVPAYPYNYFKDIMYGLDVKIYTTFFEGKPVASIFLIYHNKEMRYAFAGTIHDKKIMNLQPYHLILWQAIEDACKNGYKIFNLGGATTNTNKGGLYDFKKRWADKIDEIPSYYFLNKIKKVPTGDENVMFNLASKVWKKLPISLIKVLSSKIIKQFV